MRIPLLDADYRYFDARFELAPVKRGGAQR
jgi:hypothetical protein